jgi:hypothetical protein
MVSKKKSLVGEEMPVRKSPARTKEVSNKRLDQCIMARPVQKVQSEKKRQ